MAKPGLYDDIVKPQKSIYDDIVKEKPNLAMGAPVHASPSDAKFYAKDPEGMTPERTKYETWASSVRKRILKAASARDDKEVARLQGILDNTPAPKGPTTEQRVAHRTGKKFNALEAGIESAGRKSQASPDYSATTETGSGAGTIQGRQFSGGKQVAEAQYKTAKEAREANAKANEKIAAAITPFLPTGILGMVPGAQKAVGGFVGPNVNVPGNTFTAAETIQDPKATTAEKAGAAADLALQWAPLDAIFGKIIKGGLQKVATMAAKNSATAGKVIAKAIEKGAKAEDIVKALGGTREAQAAVDIATRKSEPIKPPVFPTKNGKPVIRVKSDAVVEGVPEVISPPKQNPAQNITPIVSRETPGVAHQQRVLDIVRQSAGLPALQKTPKQTVEGWAADAAANGYDTLAGAMGLAEQVEKGTLKHLGPPQKMGVSKVLDDLFTEHERLGSEYLKTGDPNLGNTLSVITDHINRLTNAGNIVQAEWARSGLASQWMMGDGTIVGRLAKLQKLGERQLSPDEVASVTRDMKALQEVSAQQAKRIKELEDQQIAGTISKSGKRNAKKADLDAEYDELKREFARNIAQASAGLDPAALSSLSKIVRNRAHAGYLTFEELADRIISELKDVMPGLTHKDIREAVGFSGEKQERMVSEWQRLKREVSAIDSAEKTAAGRAPSVMKEAERQRTLKRIDNLEKKMDVMRQEGIVPGRAQKVDYFSSDPEVRALRAKEGSLKRKMYQQERDLAEKTEWDKMSPTQQAMSKYNPFDLARASVASMDDSFPLNQGHFVLFSDPKAWLEGTVSGLKSFSTKSYDEVMNQIHGHPMYDTWNDAGLYEQGNLLDVFGNSKMSKIPGVKHSEQAYDANGLVMRTKLANDYASVLETAKGRSLSKDEYKNIASAIKTITGQGEWGKGIQGASKVFFALRYALSQIETGVGAPLARAYKAGDKELGKHLAKKYARAYGTAAAMLPIMDAALQNYGPKDSNNKPVAKVVWNPLSTDFGNAVWKDSKGNTHTVALIPGSMQVVSKGIQIGAAAKEAASGKMSTGSMAQGQMIGDYVKYKLHPVIGTGLTASGAQYSSNKSAFGDSYDFSKPGGYVTVGKRILPISIQDMIEANTGDLSIPERVAYSVIPFFARSQQRK